MRKGTIINYSFFFIYLWYLLFIDLYKEFQNNKGNLYYISFSSHVREMVYYLMGLKAYKDCYT